MARRSLRIDGGLIIATLDIDMPNWLKIAEKARDLRPIERDFKTRDPKIWGGKRPRPDAVHLHKERFNKKSISMTSDNRWHPPLWEDVEIEWMEKIVAWMTEDKPMTRLS